MNDFAVAKHHPDMYYPALLVLKEGKVSETGFVNEVERISAEHLLGGVSGQLHANQRVQQLDETGTVYSERSTAAQRYGEPSKEKATLRSSSIRCTRETSGTPSAGHQEAASGSGKRSLKGVLAGSTTINAPIVNTEGIRAPGMANGALKRNLSALK